MSWKASNTILATLCLPITQHDVAIERTIAFVPDSTIVNCFLYTTSEFAGYVEVKPSGTSDWIALGEFSTTPAVYLGSIDDGYEVDIEVKITLDDTFNGEVTIPIYVGSGESITAPLPEGVSYDFWQGDDTERDFFIDNDTECGNYSWQSEGDLFASLSVSS